jgi:hypothetical protein
MALHYWIQLVDSDEHYHSKIVLQWAPNAKRWCHSGNLGTDIYANHIEIFPNSFIVSQAVMP